MAASKKLPAGKVRIEANIPQVLHDFLTEYAEANYMTKTQALVSILQAAQKVQSEVPHG